MADYNIQMKVYDETQGAFNKLYPKTKFELIEGLSTIVVCTISPALSGVTVTLSNASNTFSAVSNSNGVATINVNVFGTYAVSFSNQYVTSTTTSLDVQFYGVYNIDAVYEPLVTYTAIIDENNSNPLTCITYADDAAGMTKGASAWDSKPIFTKIKPCVFQNGVVNYYLNPDNYAQKADGSVSDLTGTDGDVMVEFSKFAYRIYRSGTNLYISISNDPTAITADSRFTYNAFSRDSIGDRDKMYIGAYHGYTINSKLRSVSGQLPTVSQTIGTFRTQAQANGTGYQQFTFYQLTALQCLYIIKYGNLNSQSALGMGYVAGSAAKVSGQTNANGMYYGTTSSTQSVKFAGIEDFWGNVYDWIDGFYCGSNWNILTGYKEYNNTGSGYTNNGQGASSNVSGYISKTQGINSNTGFVIKTGNGSSNTYYADYGALCASGLPDFGGYWSYSGDAGAFRLYVNDSASYADATLGARLSYC